MIRPITPEDYNNMISILQVGPRSRYKIRNIRLIGEPNKKKWDGFFSVLWKSSAGWVKVDDSGKVVGVCLGVAVENFWDTKTIGRIVLWYVEPEYRGITAIRLIDHLLGWFRFKEVDYSIAACDFDSDASRAYKRLGFKPLEETLYLVEV